MLEDQKPSPPQKNRGAAHVAAGIFLSRISGLIRERIFAHYFGNSDAGDAFKAALKIPNLLQNLFGEGVLSASFIPIYANLRARGKHDEADRVASVIAALLSLVTALLVLLGILATPFLIDLIAPGFAGEKRLLTISLVQIFFPGVGLLVMSAWCLGILNSHRKFFLSYAAPVLWNAAIIAALLFGGGTFVGERHGQFDLAIIAAWGLVAGSLLQFLVQLPKALSLIGRFRPSFRTSLPEIRTVLKNFLPAVLSRGVVQISAYIDNILASLLQTGAVSALSYAQTLYLLPVSLFGMSVSAAELPNLSSATGDEKEVALHLQTRINHGLERIAFFIVPSVIAFLALGDVIVGLIFQSGVFDRSSTLYVWAVLAGASLGLLATTFARLYSSAFYALRDTKTPLRFALIRVSIGIVLGVLLSLALPPLFDLDPKLGTVGLAIATSLSGFIEFVLLRRALNRRIGNTGLISSHVLKLWGCALVAAGLASLMRPFSADFYPALFALITLPIYGACYLGFTAWAGIRESRGMARSLWKR